MSLRAYRMVSLLVAAVLVAGVVGALGEGLRPARRVVARAAAPGAPGVFLRARSDAVAPASTARLTARSQPQPATPPSGTTSAPTLPAPTGALPAVAPASTPREVDAVVWLPGSITDAEIQALTHTQGVAAIEEVDTGTVQLAGAPVATFGVDPGTFRNFTPAASASDDPLWQYITGGAVAASYDMASDRKLTLGARLPIVPAGGGEATSGWVGAFVSIGIPGVDMVVDNDESTVLGLKPNSGLVVSAPLMDPGLLGSTLRQDLPGATVEVTSPALFAAASVPVSGQAVPAPTPTLASAVSAALSRVGDPYVWGGDGPTQFDCSGLVQWSFAQAGIAMPRTAAEQYLAGTPVTLAEAQPGDLLFWHYDPSDPSYIDHVAIYLGGGKMVVAPHTGTDVQVATVPLDDFAGAVRVVPTTASQMSGSQYTT